MSVPQYYVDPTGRAPEKPTAKNIWGILALAAGIAGVVFAWMVVGGALGIAGLIFGLVGLSAVKRGAASNKSLNIWGIVLSAVAMFLSAVFLVVFLAFGAWAANEAQSTGTTDSEVAPEPSAPADPSETDPPPATGGEFPIETDVTMALAVRAEQLDAPKGFGGEAPTDQDYDFAWGDAVETDGQIAVVTATIRYKGDARAASNSGSLELLSQSGEEYVEEAKLGYGMGLFNIEELAPGEEQTFEASFVVPASEIDSVKVRVTLLTDKGEGRQFEIG